MRNLDGSGVQLHLQEAENGTHIYEMVGVISVGL